MTAVLLGLAGAAVVLCGYITAAIRADRRPTWTPPRNARPHRGDPRARFNLEPWPTRQTPTDLAAAYYPWTLPLEPELAWKRDRLSPPAFIGRPPARERVPV